MLVTLQKYEFFLRKIFYLQTRLNLIRDVGILDYLMKVYFKSDYHHQNVNQELNLFSLAHFLVYYYILIVGQTFALVLFLYEYFSFKPFVLIFKKQLDYLGFEFNQIDYKCLYKNK